MEKHVYFVRHGESNSNVDGIHRGSEALLSEKGREQAVLVAHRIAHIGVDALVSSPFPRARATAEAIAGVCTLGIEESDLFVERRRPSVMNGKKHHDPESVKIMGEVFEGYLATNHRYSDEGNFEDLKKRANAALDFLVSHSAERICVVTHGLFLRILFVAALNSDFTGRDLRNALDGLETNNTGVSHFRYKEAFDTKGHMHWQVVQWNDSAHLG